MANKPIDPVAPIVVGQKEWTKEDEEMCEKLHQSEYWITLQKIVHKMVDEKNEELLDGKWTVEEIPSMFLSKTETIRTLHSLLVFISHAGKRIQAQS